MWPAMHNIVAQWIPPNERSKFLTCIMGSSIGVGVFYPLFGYVIALTSWEWIFHIISIIGIIWFICWQYFVYDSPNQHPNIDRKEKDFILKSLDGTYTHQQKVIIIWLRNYCYFLHAFKNRADKNSMEINFYINTSLDEYFGAIRKYVVNNDIDGTTANIFQTSYRF